MELTIVNQMLLEAVTRLRDERTDRSLYHVLQGKRSATSLQDAHFYELEPVFGMLPFKRETFDRLLTELERQGLIERDTTLRVTEIGKAQVAAPFLIDDLGGELRGFSITLWKRISLLIQTLVCLEQRITFVPIQQDVATKEWVRQQIKHIPNRKQWLEGIHRELRDALRQLSDREATLISYRLSGLKTGLSYPQLQEQLDSDTLSLRLEFIMAWRKCLRHLNETSIILQLGSDIDQSKMTQSAQKTWEMLKRGQTLDEIAHRRRLKKSTMEDHLVEIAMYSDVFPLGQFIGEAEWNEVKQVVNREHTYSLKRIKAELTSEIDYFQIRIALARTRWEET
ncbi:helix-turn-helix domain-containing protein [Exiguobacterium sp. s193]|uniref:helix-turn-helix domain-containing protein n=1 Tax=Exiguobacterium sp. s193 TaxID=2751207 RepID=UPI001BEC8B2A|nr:helix-turn-helix domain-containing protein [Exiguobacterium sp. s193]